MVFHFLYDFDLVNEPPRPSNVSCKKASQSIYYPVIKRAKTAEHDLKL